MATTVDTLISNLDARVNHASLVASNYTGQAKTTAAGEPITIPDVVIQYVSSIDKPKIELPPEWDNEDTLAVVGQLVGTLNAFFDAYFPTVSTEYTDWISLLSGLVQDGVPVLEDNEQLNLMRQKIDEAEGKRNKHTTRSQYSNAGYSLPPGSMVRDTLNDIDIRSERLMMQSISTAQQLTSDVINSYKQVISTALSVDDSRKHALKVMSDMMAVAADMHTANTEKKVALLRAKSETVQAMLAYYKAESTLDDVNTKIYEQNVKLRVQRYDADANFFGKNEGLQVRAGIAAADHAARISAAAYSALNTIVSASTVGFG